jgi:hypothetical protein
MLEPDTPSVLEPPVADCSAVTPSPYGPIFTGPSSKSCFLWVKRSRLPVKAGTPSLAARIAARFG